MSRYLLIGPRKLNSARSTRSDERHVNSLIYRSAEYLSREHTVSECRIDIHENGLFSEDSKRMHIYYRTSDSARAFQISAEEDPTFARTFAMNHSNFEGTTASDFFLMRLLQSCLVDVNDGKPVNAEFINPILQNERCACHGERIFRSKLSRADYEQRIRPMEELAKEKMKKKDANKGAQVDETDETDGKRKRRRRRKKSRSKRK